MSRARRLSLGAGLVMVPLVFWLGANEVFEKPKTIALLLYSCFLLPLSLPLLLDKKRWTPRRRKVAFIALGMLTAATLSFVNAASQLPGNRLLGFEMLAPLWASALGGLVFLLESRSNRQRILFYVLVAHILLTAYGLIQIADQMLAQSLGFRLDMIQWVSFGVTRVYSTMGNPDYMAAQFSLFVPLLLGLGWRQRGPWLKAAFQVATFALALIPLLLLLVTGLHQGFKIGAWWLLFALALFVLGRKLSERTLALTLLYAIALLVLVAQGRAAILGFFMSLFVMLIILAKTHGLGYLKQRAKFLATHAGIALGIPLLVLFFLLGVRAASPQLGFLKSKPVAGMLGLADSVKSRVTQMGDTDNHSWVVRKFYYRSALHMGMERPWLGVGIGNHAMFTAASQSVLWKQWQKEKNPAIKWVEPHVELYTHNDFIQNFAEMGMLGLLAFLILWGWFIRDAWRFSRSGSPQNRLLAVGLLGLAAAFAVSAALNFPWRVVASLQLCWLAFGVLASVGDTPPDEAKLSKPVLAASVAVLMLALIPAVLFVRWFPASVFIKQGNQMRDIKNPAAAVLRYEKANQIGLSGTQRVEHHLYLGSMYNMLNRHQEAIAWFKKGIQAYPNFIEARYNLGYTYMTLREKTKDPVKKEAYWKQAVAQYEAVLEINPRYNNALNNLGNMYYAKRDFKKAGEFYERLLRFNSKQWQTHYNLGALYMMQAKNKDAREHLLKASLLNPSYPQSKLYYERLKGLPEGSVLKF